MEIQWVESFDELDKEKFKALVEAGFGKPLVDWYFEYCSPEYVCLAVEGDVYAGAIVVEKVPDSEVCYLDKIVVTPQLQGNGIGAILWIEVSWNSEKLVWRARKDNPFNSFYDAKSDGKLCFPELPEYFVYYYGLNQGEIQKAVDYAVGKKPTLAEQ